MNDRYNHYSHNYFYLIIINIPKNFLWHAKWRDSDMVAISLGRSRKIFRTSLILRYLSLSLFLLLPSLSLLLSMIHTSPRNPLNFQWAEDFTISGRRSRGLNSGNKFANKFLRKFATPWESSSREFWGQLGRNKLSLLARTKFTLSKERIKIFSPYGIFFTIIICDFLSVLRFMYVM